MDKWVTRTQTILCSKVNLELRSDSDLSLQWSCTSTPVYTPTSNNSLPSFTKLRQAGNSSTQCHSEISHAWVMSSLSFWNSGQQKQSLFFWLRARGSDYGSVSCLLRENSRNEVVFHGKTRSLWTFARIILVAILALLILQFPPFTEIISCTESYLRTRFSGRAKGA